MKRKVIINYFLTRAAPSEKLRVALCSMVTGYIREINMFGKHSAPKNPCADAAFAALIRPVSEWDDLALM